MTRMVRDYYAQMLLARDAPGDAQRADELAGGAATLPRTELADLS